MPDDEVDLYDDDDDDDDDDDENEDGDIFYELDLGSVEPDGAITSRTPSIFSGEFAEPS